MDVNNRYSCEYNICTNEQSSKSQHYQIWLSINWFWRKPEIYNYWDLYPQTPSNYPFCDLVAPWADTITPSYSRKKDLIKKFPRDYYFWTISTPWVDTIITSSLRQNNQIFKLKAKRDPPFWDLSAVKSNTITPSH